VRACQGGSGHNPAQGCVAHTREIDSSKADNQPSTYGNQCEWNGMLCGGCKCSLQSESDLVTVVPRDVDEHGKKEQNWRREVED
jgi:hypothetical protein